MDNCSSHTSKITKEFITARSIRVIDRPPYSPNLAPADFFSFPTAKRAIAGLTIEGKTIKTEWERVCGSLSSEDFANTFKKWTDRWNKCIEREGDYVEK